MKNRAVVRKEWLEEAVKRITTERVEIVIQSHRLYVWNYKEDEEAVKEDG